ncbi:hypothetical protein [Paenibacillus sp. Marseille-Q4541]|uniref:hypothetical protein n=1 Tax=Paenibacillus sp. Marseille-Q4541 TaxID=2831522 RepID=UPI001BAD35A0|nr:hypothetical protein [Paenibacillus sp. Marseille-Q4541]
MVGKLKLSKAKHVIYMLIAGGMILYALPNLSFTGWNAAFSATWLGFALLVIGANLHFILGVDEEKKKALDRVRRSKLRQWELKWSDDKESGKKVKIVPAKERSQ